MNPVYQLTPADLELARHAAQIRHEKSDAKGFANTDGLAETDAMRVDFLGCLGELAWARMNDQEPRLDEGTMKNPDFVDSDGVRWHVRTTDRRDGCLIVRPRDPMTDRYVLITVDLERGEAVAAGWHYGKMVPKIGEWDERAGRSGAWWFRQSRLHKWPADDW